MTLRIKIVRASIAATMLAASVFGTAKATTLRLNTRTIYERAVTSNITLSQDGSTLQLASGEVFQDDGPASGFSYKPNTEALSPGIEIRKQLLISDPRASKAVLMVGGSGDLKVEVNGNPQKLGKAQQIFAGQWQAYNIDLSALKPGVNNIVIRGTGKVRIARADDSYVELPHRSARSTDGGKSWSVDGLGPQGNVSGEYYVRLYLEHFVSNGSILLPVMDIANMEGNPLAPPLSEPGPLRVSVSTAADTTSGVTLRVRSGTVYAPNQETWSEWMSLGRDGMLNALRGHFVQVEVTLATTDPLITPRLSGINLIAEPTLAEDWTKTVKVIDSHNEEIVRTSIPFRYEPFTHPELKELRSRYRLDDVVNGAKTDLDIITRLAAWSSRQWKWAEWHLDEFYPPWDALEILKKLPDGKPVGGFCQQYNLVFLQAAESFGFVGRDISIDSGRLGRPTVIGHEAVEIWSNQFRKWIWVDGMMAYYAVDNTTGVPLSLSEIRQRQLRLLRGQEARPTRIVHIVDTKMPATPVWLKRASEWHELDRDMSFAEMRLIPRSNFLEEKWPLPLDNGKSGWTWTGFDVWTDAEVPAQLLHPNLITSHGNFEWTLDQAHFVLEPTSTQDEILVHLDTVTPGFESFEANVDGKGESPVSAIFTWKLHAGRNQLKVWPRNNAGRDGIASWIDLEVPRLQPR
jgi:hypothetical protein